MAELRRSQVLLTHLISSRVPFHPIPSRPIPSHPIASHLRPNLIPSQVLLNHLVAHLFGLSAAELHAVHEYVRSWTAHAEEAREDDDEAADAHDEAMQEGVEEGTNDGERAPPPPPKRAEPLRSCDGERKGVVAREAEVADRPGSSQSLSMLI
jgi:hypothetical protein